MAKVRRRTRATLHVPCTHVLSDPDTSCASLTAAELRVVSRHPRYKTEICKTFHTIGTCPYGRRCRFIHNEVAPPPAPTAIGATLYNLSTMGNSTDAAELALGSEVRTPALLHALRRPSFCGRTACHERSSGR